MTLSVNNVDNNRVGELDALTNALAAGQSADVQAFGTLAERAPIETCIAFDVKRFCKEKNIEPCRSIIV